MVSARRSFEGALPIAAMSRLCEALAGTDGVAQFELDFGRDSLGTDYLDVRAQASLTLVCQRTLETFVLPVAVNTRLGLIKLERDEAGLPPNCEPLLVAEDG
ncbi:MAG: YceD family protein, partial [Rhodanobacter sp.]